MYSRVPLEFPRRVAVPKTTRVLDGTRRWANLLLAIAQGTLALAFIFGVWSRNAAGFRRDPPIVPAFYELAVWMVIAVGCIVYAFYQFGAARRADAVLRRVGSFTAAGFLGCCAWLLAAGIGRPAFAIPALCWTAACLFFAFMPLWKLRGVAPCFRWCVVAPISIYAGCLSVAISALAARNFRLVLGQPPGSVALLLSATLLILVVLRRSGGNLFFAATVAWGLIGIGVRNQFELKNRAAARIVWVSLIAFVAAAAWLAVRGNREDEYEDEDEILEG
ncbi:MAG TPA: hypothetical protein VGL22_18655 [Terracidiphilus sp.]